MAVAVFRAEAPHARFVLDRHPAEFREVRLHCPVPFPTGLWLSEERRPELDDHRRAVLVELLRRIRALEEALAPRRPCVGVGGLHVGLGEVALPVGRVRHHHLERDLIERRRGRGGAVGSRSISSCNTPVSCDNSAAAGVGANTIAGAAGAGAIAGAGAGASAGASRNNDRGRMLFKRLPQLPHLLLGEGLGAFNAATRP